MFIVNLAIFDFCMMLEMPMLLYNSVRFHMNFFMPVHLIKDIFSIFNELLGVTQHARYMLYLVALVGLVVLLPTLL